MLPGGTLTRFHEKCLFHFYLLSTLFTVIREA